ncbi:hypothetical protein [Fusibacter sp. 3D3]|uniref:hypothetical protein n=1 Tax=Fusibacter sp. 3D3 TaxID=1048380 RepID=UPI000852EBF3|nr:hypothetical protein [Fusibacter sp. 3D3]
MKKIIVPIIIILPVLFYLIFVVKLSHMTSLSIEIKANDKSGITSLETNVEDQAFIASINSIITEKRYLKQPLYHHYSRNEIDYEITSYNMNESNKLKTRYRILLNIDEESNVANRSRIDVIRIEGEIENKFGSFSVFLTDEQVKELTKCIQDYLSQ